MWRSVKSMAYLSSNHLFVQINGKSMAYIYLFCEWFSESTIHKKIYIYIIIYYI